LAACSREQYELRFLLHIAGIACASPAHMGDPTEEITPDCQGIPLYIGASRSTSTVPEALVLLDSGEPIDVLFTDIGLKGDIHAGLELAKEARSSGPISRCFTQPAKASRTA
jgi:hypothetical protein